MKKMLSLILPVAALAALLAGACLLYGKLAPGTATDNLTPSASPSHSAPEEGQTEPEVIMAPDFTVYTADGEPALLSDFAGMPVVVNFWASWCGPCRMEMPHFETLSKELEGKAAFMMIDAADGQRETVDSGAGFIKEQGYTFPVYFDTTQQAVITYGIYAFPTTLFIGADGQLVAHAVSSLDEATLRRGIEMILPQ